MWFCASSEKPVGQSVQDGAARRRSWLARGIEHAMDVARADRTAHGDMRLEMLGARRPPVRLTITDWISTFAIRSAACTA